MNIPIGNGKKGVRLSVFHIWKGVRLSVFHIWKTKVSPKYLNPSYSRLLQSSRNSSLKIKEEFFYLYSCYLIKNSISILKECRKKLLLALLYLSSPLLERTDLILYPFPELHVSSQAPRICTRLFFFMTPLWGISEDFKVIQNSFSRF